MSAWTAAHGGRFPLPGADLRAIASPGMGGYTPGLTGGHLLTGPAGHGLYSRGRGRGADDMLVTGAGLWIASDNLDGTDRCGGGVGGHAGICFLPYTS